MLSGRTLVMRFVRTSREGDGTGCFIAAGCLAAIFRAVFFLESAGLAFLRGMRISPLRSRLRIKADGTEVEKGPVGCGLMILQEMSKVYPKANPEPMPS